jgi:hypothetical protein
MDPLMELMSQNESEADLSQKIQHLFHSIISDPDCEVLTAQDFVEKIARKRFRGGVTIHISHEDYEAFTENGKLCDADGNLTFEMFELAMRKELKTYIQRQVSGAGSRVRFGCRGQGWG